MMLRIINNIGNVVLSCLLVINCCDANGFQKGSSMLEQPIIPQEKIEQGIEKLADLFERSKMDSAYTLANQIAHSARVHKMVQAEVSANYKLAGIYNRQNNFEKSDSLIKISLPNCEDDDLSFNMSILSYNNAMRLGEFENAALALDQSKQFIGDSLGVNMVRYKYTLADYLNSTTNDDKVVLDLLLEAKKKAPKDIDYKMLFNINYQLVALYTSIDVFDQALLVGEENEKLAIENENYYYQLFGILSQLNCNRSLKNHEAIYQLVQRAIKVKEEHNESSAFGFVYFTQGESYLEQNKLDSAFHYFDLGEKICLERNATFDLSRNYLGKSETYFKQKEYDLAKKFADQAKEMSSDHLVGLDEMYWRLAAVKGDYKSAYMGALASLEQVNEEINSGENYEIISELLTEKFSAEKEKQQLEIKEKEKRNNLLLAIGLISGGLFFTLLTAFIQIRNRNKLKKLNASLVKKNDALTNFSYICSHDLKEPVRNIVSFSNLLEQSMEESNAPAKELEFATIIKNCSNTLLEIVRSLKVFSETAFDEELRLETFNVQDVFNEIEINMQQAITAKNAELVFMNPNQMTSLTFSRPMLYLLLQNLVQNALKYNDAPTPKVKIEVTSENGTNVFSVADNGRGIDPEKIEYIFKPFKTLQSKSLSQSSGLGLSICKNILEKYGGNIWVESKENEGSTFYFSVPKTFNRI